MSINLLTKDSLPDVIAKKITEQIIKGELKPGEKIIETVFANKYNVSRASLREALYKLAKEGLIERKPRKGSIVKSYSISDVYDLLRLRLMIEDLAIEKIAMRGVSPSIVQEMKSLTNLMEENEPADDYSRLNHNFHLLIIEMTQSKVMIDMYYQLGLPLLILQTISFVKSQSVLDSLQDHKAIVRCFEKEEIEQVRVILNSHNHEVIRRVRTQLNYV